MAAHTTNDVVTRTGLSRRRLQSWVHAGNLRADIPGPTPHGWEFSAEELRIARLRRIACMLRNDVHRLEDREWTIVINPAAADLETLERPTLAVSTQTCGRVCGQFIEIPSGAGER